MAFRHWWSLRFAGRLLQKEQLVLEFLQAENQILRERHQHFRGNKRLLLSKK